MRKNLYEIFEEVSAAKSTQERVDLLRANESWTLIQLLKGVYNPDVKFTVKEIPAYHPSDSPAGMSYGNIDMVMRKAYLFQEGHPNRPQELSEKRQSHILIQMLESLEAKEAEIFSNMLLKRLNVRGMSRMLVDVAFPGKI